MKTMNFQQLRNLVLSGYVPTSNVDRADLQDIVNKRPMEELVALLLNEETKINAMALMEVCMEEECIKKLRAEVLTILREHCAYKTMQTQIEDIYKQMEQYKKNYDLYNKLMNL